MAALSDAEAGMRPALGLTFVATAAMLLSGCGTVRNLASGDPDNYGGVQKDLADWQAAGTGRGLSGPAQGTHSWPMAVLLVAILPAELSLSFVGDTLTLPYVIYQRDKKNADSGEPVLPIQAGGNPVSPAGQPVVSERNPLDWGAGEGWGRSGRQSGPPQPERMEAPTGAPLPSTPPIAVAGPPQ
jgi:uncharacterized protein YceK